MSAQNLASWVDRTGTRDDLVTAAPLAAMSATLDAAEPFASNVVPPLWHWCFFLPVARESELGPDGHPRRGDFLPPVDLPRRMWAGGRLTFERLLTVGERVSRTSRIASVEAKEGRTGPLFFVTVHHDYSTDQGPAIHEEHDIVYREMPAPDAIAPVPPLAPAKEGYAREIVPDPVLLFRYSALTFNGHRIHYDRDYVTQVEGYPGLVVHGPLVATLLLDLLRRQQPGARVKTFEFRAVSPLFDIHRFRVCGRDEGDGRHALWAVNHKGELAMKATAVVA